MPYYNKGPCSCCGEDECIECPLCKDCTSGQAVSVTITGITGSDSIYNGTYNLTRSLVDPCTWVYFELGFPVIAFRISESGGNTIFTIDADDCVVWSTGGGEAPANCRERLMSSPFVDCGYNNWTNAEASWGWGDKCCTCEDCSFCPGEEDSVWIVLEGTDNDGTFEGVWNGTGWVINFGVCSTVLTCVPGGGGLQWDLFQGGPGCPMGGPCFVGGIDEGSPLVLTFAPDCDNCDMGLPNGTMSIYWTCVNPPEMMRAAAVPVCDDGIINRPSVYMVTYNSTAFEIPSNDICSWDQDFDSMAFYIEPRQVKNGIQIVCTIHIGESYHEFTSEVLPHGFDGGQTLVLTNGDTSLTLVPEYY